MESWANYSSIVHSLPFTFLVGPNHTKLTIQSGLARHVSQPLDNLMNGETRESKHHCAILEEEDVETFVAFCEYAYTGDYNVPPPGFREDYKEKIVNNPFKRMLHAESGAVPPPAPSPPQSIGAPEKEENTSQFGGFRTPEWDRPAAPEAKEGPEGSVGAGEDFKTPIDPHHESAIAPEEPSEQPPSTEKLPPSEQLPSEQPPPAPAAEEAEPSDPNAGNAKGKKGKKDKKNKKNKKGAAEEITSTMTPPSTPPPEKPADQADSDPAPAPAEAPAVEEGPAPDEAPKDPEAAEAIEAPELGEAPAEEAKEGEGEADENWGEPGPSAPMTETWEQPAPTPPEADTAVKENEKEHEGRARQQSRPFIDTSFAKQHFASPRKTGFSKWEEFQMIEYVDQRVPWGTRPPSPLSMDSRASNSDLPYLTFHAKIYVFATRYLIPALAQLCLRKLHRDLLHLGFPDGSPDYEDEEMALLSTTKARMVLDLLHYTYNKSTRLEPINPTSATQLRDNELRKLVIHYAACKVQDLARYCPPVESMMGTPSGQPVDIMSEKPSARGLRALLDTTTELASDLVYRMM
ncbi:hypothetical protein AWENTII_006037 [Aspergillus wentii]|nr:hypothetical protein MW887_000084 [Aspergillus wentii]